MVPPHSPSHNKPSSPPLTATSEPTWLTGVALKAVNEHTFATQRAKKASDRAKGKAPSHSFGSSPPSSLPSSMSSARGAVMASIWAEVWDARKNFSSGDDGDWPELPTPPLPSALTLSQRNLSEYALRPTQDREVPLSSLVRPVKMRGTKAKEREFEFLPPVKNVIALDDAESNAPDEPWEYISSVGGDDEARKIFSYAEIVSKSA
ncbi:hypothetical protein B0F90DRAFT_1738531 [Multifurca ochricompacta]|uniref:Uncharacterized protein n=1 Tax=Multifurca ochricompacta TaxID=376703 RepID=A0AAD4M1A5_9AGAM|nr:hypothetical protein B0F90DRAFT_1738531 [Multifurca ochricompacta]